MSWPESARYLSLISFYCSSQISPDGCRGFDSGLTSRWEITTSCYGATGHYFYVFCNGPHSHHSGVLEFQCNVHKGLNCPSSGTGKQRRTSGLCKTLLETSETIWFANRITKFVSLRKTLKRLLDAEYKTLPALSVYRKVPPPSQRWAHGWGSDSHTNLAIIARHMQEVLHLWHWLPMSTMMRLNHTFEHLELRVCVCVWCMVQHQAVAAPGSHTGARGGHSTQTP